MQWGIHLPHLGRRVDAASIVEFAREAERLDCHSVWVSDHVCWPTLSNIESRYPYSENGDFLVSPDKDWLDPIGTLFYAAAVTRKVLLATSVLILPYRPPVITAKQLASLDVLSGGRVLLGVGVGWMAEEARILGMPWDRRGKRSDEQLEVFKTLFESQTPSFDGEFYSFPEVGFFPKPLQQPLPVWVGGSSPAAFERAARHAQGFH
ncbi:MAG: TIGR03619 family F420-dependent LLM class oxidoreductase, partial [Gammaproteobacteria bacterium]|nr:TIGR03619 family F420-dependent LLM class oxidoreductase [Gammaproteobacteria bacterium]